MSGRPKAGRAPTCTQFGPCLAPRVRRTKGQAGQVERCRNCAKPLTHKSLETWVQERTSVPVDQVVSSYKQAYPNANLTSSSVEVCKNAAKWLSKTLQLGSVEGTYVLLEGKPVFHIADFVYCHRHMTVPTKLYLKQLLDKRDFQKASKSIQDYERTHGVRLVRARQYYNERIRAYNKR